MIKTFKIPIELLEINLQYCKGTLGNCKFIKLSDDFDYTYIKRPDQTWKDYFLALRGEDISLDMDCMISLGLIELFNSPNRNNSNSYCIFGEPVGLIYRWVEDPVDLILAACIDSHLGIGLLPSENADMFIALGETGLDERTEEDWIKFLYNAIKKDFIERYSEEEYNNRKDGWTMKEFHCKYSQVVGYLLTNPKFNDIIDIHHNAGRDHIFPAQTVNVICDSEVISAMKDQTTCVK